MDLINHLEQAIERHTIRFTRNETPKPFASRYMRQLTMQLATGKFIFQVDDEFDDVDGASPELLLNMVLMECTWYEEEDDYLTWCTSKGLDARNEMVRDYYMGLGAEIVKIKKLLNNLAHTSFFDWQLNGGDAQTLRKLSAKSS